MVPSPTSKRIAFPLSMRTYIPETFRCLHGRADPVPVNNISALPFCATGFFERIAAECSKAPESFSNLFDSTCPFCQHVSILHVLEKPLLDRGRTTNSSNGFAAITSTEFSLTDRFKPPNGSMVGTSGGQYMLLHILDLTIAPKAAE